MLSHDTFLHTFSADMQSLAPEFKQAGDSRFVGLLAITALTMSLFCLPARAGLLSPQVAAGATPQICTGQTQDSERPQHTATSLTDTQASVNEADDDNSASQRRLTPSAPQSTSQAEKDGEYCKRERRHPDSAPGKTESPSEPTHSSPRPAPTAVQPLTTYSNGKLAIHAEGEDLATVLASIRSVAGINVTLPPDAPIDPVYLILKPEKLQDALIALLDGSPYNYIIENASGESPAPASLILSVRTISSPALVASADAQGTSSPQKPALYGAGYQEDSQVQTSDADLPLPIQPSSVPDSVPVGVNLQQMATDSHTTVGQVLADLQRKQQQTLDNQATAAAASQNQQ